MAGNLVMGRSGKLFLGFALAYGSLAYLLYLIGLAGFFKILPAAALLSAGMAAGLYYLISNRRIFFDAFKALGSDKWAAAFIASAGFLLALQICAIFLPPTAHDALCYHLNIPKRWAQDGVIGYYPHLVNSLFPFLIQVYFGAAILLKQAWAAHLFHWLCGVGLLTGVWSLGRKLEGIFTASASVIILLSTPGIFNQMSLPLNDIALVFFSFAMWFAVCRGIESGFRSRYFIAAGMLGGFAMGIKYFAALHILAAFIPALFLAMRNKIPGGRILKCIFLFACFALLFCFVWYLRSWIVEGNPVYPYFSNVFSGGESAGYDFGKQGYGKGLMDLILIPWRITMEPRKFGGTWNQIGLIYLVFLPLLFKKTAPGTGYWKWVAAVYFFEWFYVVQNLRFAFALLPVLAVLIALEIRPFRYFLIPLLALNVLFAVYHTKDAVKHWVSGESSDRYLQREDATYPVIRNINAQVPAGEKILAGDFVRLYYFEAEPVRAKEFFKREAVDWTHHDLVRKLKGQGINWVVVSKADSDILAKRRSEFAFQSELGGGFNLYRII